MTVISLKQPSWQIQAQAALELRNRKSKQQGINAVEIFNSLCEFTDKQKIATAAALEHKYTLFGGSRGPGKSKWLRWFLVFLLLQWAEQGLNGVRVLLACEDYPTLRKRQIVKIQSEFPTWLGRYYAGERKEFVLVDKYGGGVIEMGNLNDIGNYLSAEYATIAIDELVRNEFDAFNKLRGSLRWPGIDVTYFVGATNPEANWVRDIWIERRFDNDEYKELSPIKDQFYYVPGLPTDNPHLPQSYWDMLNTLTPSLYQAWVLGDWYAAVEGLVYSNFSEDNLTDMEPDPDKPIELGIDDGYIDPRAILFIQSTPTHILVFDELYHHKYLEEESVDAILEKCNNAEWANGREEKNKLPEMAAVAHEAVGLRKRLRQANIPARNWLSQKAGGNVSTRNEAIKRTRGLICDGKKHRSLLVHRRCTNLIDEITMGYKYPPGRRGLNEKPLDGNDHAAQALENWCWLRVKG